MFYQIVLGENINYFYIKNINIFKIFKKEYVLYIKAYGFSYNIIDYIALNLLYKLPGYKYINLYLSKKIILSSCLKTNNQVNFL